MTIGMVDAGEEQERGTPGGIEGAKKAKGTVRGARFVLSHACCKDLVDLVCLFSAISVDTGGPPLPDAQFIQPLQHVESLLPKHLSDMLPLLLRPELMQCHAAAFIEVPCDMSRCTAVLGHLVLLCARLRRGAY